MVTQTAGSGGRAGGRQPGMATTGALSGMLSTLVFIVVHDLTISDIWFMAMPMVVAGAASGAAIAGTYARLGVCRTAAGWVGFNAWMVALLGTLGGVSLLVYEPVTTMAAVMAVSGPVDRLILQALPLTGAFVVVATLLTGRLYARNRSDHPRILATITLVTALLGPNLSVLGMVDFDGSSVAPVLAFFGLAGLLASVYTLAFVALRRDLAWRRAIST